MDKSSEEKMFGLLDVIATGVQDLHGEIGSLRNEMHGEIGALRSEMHVEIGALRSEMHEGFARVDRRLSNVETRLESLESSRA